ncbi:MAG: hypothetical protein JSR71_05935 [Proteobacteria bacterium]|nr:hypothetical protein [Pseudomonadota bacterium]
MGAHDIVRVIATKVTQADCQQAPGLITSIPAQCLISDKVYENDTIVEQTGSHDMQAVIPPRKNRKELRMTNTYTGNTTSSRTHFLRSEHGAASPSATPRSFLPLIAAIRIRYHALWPKNLWR